MGNDIHIHVNGEARAWSSGGTVADLLQALDIQAERVAIELNLEILDRALFSRRHLADGDRVEILSFIGGGAKDLGHRMPEFSSEAGAASINAQGGRWIYSERKP